MGAMIPHPAYGGGLHRWAVKVLALFLAVDIGLAGARLPAGIDTGQGTREETSQPTRPASALPSAAELQKAADLQLDSPVRVAVNATDVVEKARALAREIPALESDLAARARSLGPGVEPSFLYVRDHVRYEAYPGVLRGASGAYLSQAGNAYDRSLVLAELLRLKGTQTRFAGCRLSRARAEQLLDRIFEPVSAAGSESGRQPLPSSAPAFQQRVRKRALRDYGAITTALGANRPFRASPPREDVLKEIEDHIWVQAQTDRGWIDLDPAFVQATPGNNFCAPALVFETIPDERHQRVAIRVIVERLSDGSLTNETVLEATHTAADLVDRPALLIHSPTERVGNAVTGGLAAGLLGPDTWTPFLWAAGSLRQGTPTSFADQKRSETGGPLGGSGLSGVFGALGKQRHFVSETLEFEMTFPNGRREIIRRTLLDRAGMAWRKAGALDANSLRPLARDKDGLLFPGWIHNIWFSAGQHNLSAYAEAMSAAVASAASADPAPQGGSAPFQEAAWPFALQNFSFLLYSDHVIIPSLNDLPTHRFYADSPRIFIVSAGPTAEQVAGATLYGFEYDLRRDHLRGMARQASDEDTVVARKIWFGALESALEHETAALHAVALGGDVSHVRSTSALLTGDPALVFSQDAVKSGKVLAADPEAAARMSQALESGATLIVPPSVLRGGLAGWWEIDPEGAECRAVLDHLTSWHSAAVKLPPPSWTPTVIPGGGGKPAPRKGASEYFGMIAMGIALLAAVSIGLVIMFREQVLRLAEHVQDILNMARRSRPAPSPENAPEPERREADPGDCTKERHRELQDDVDSLCHGAPGCRPADDLATLESKRDRLKNCHRARQRIHSECYGPKSTPRDVRTDADAFEQSAARHREAEANAGAAVSNCDELIRKKQGGEDDFSSAFSTAARAYAPRAWCQGF